jgi:hypothetical protein
MPGPTPLVPNHRLIFRYTVGGLQHKQTFYVGLTASGDVTGFDTIARSGFAATGLHNAIEVWFQKMAPFYDPGDSSFDSATVEVLISGTWIFLSAYTPSAVPTASGDYVVAGSMAFSGKDTANLNFPVYLLEPIILIPKKNNSLAAMDANSQAVAISLFNVDGSAIDQDPVAWRLSRGGLYSQRWLAQVTDTNERLRRIRHIK